MNQPSAGINPPILGLKLSGKRGFPGLLRLQFTLIQTLMGFNLRRNYHETIESRVANASPFFKKTANCRLLVGSARSRSACSILLDLK